MTRTSIRCSLASRRNSIGSHSSSSAFDLVIFNASFHYSVNYERTFAEAVRCTCPGGSIVIADTPWYAEEESGRRMVEEKRERFLRSLRVRV